MMVLSTMNQVIEWVVFGQNLVKTKCQHFVKGFWSKFVKVSKFSKVK